MSALELKMVNRSCPVCASPEDSVPFAESNVDLSRLNAFAFASRKIPEYMHWRLVECRRCDLVYASPAPAPPSLTFAVGHNRRGASARLLGRKSPIFDIEYLQLFFAGERATSVDNRRFRLCRGGLDPQSLSASLLGQAVAPSSRSERRAARTPGCVAHWPARNPATGRKPLCDRVQTRFRIGRALTSTPSKDGRIFKKRS
jgi:hypothetical protein